MAKPVRLHVTGVPEHFNLPWHLAIEEGAFVEQGVEVVWQDAPGGTGAMMQQLENGEADIAIALTEGVVASIIKGVAAKIAQLFVQTPLSWGIHVAANSEFNAVEDLKGSRFAISRPTSGSHLMAFVLAQQSGWLTKKMSFVEVGGIEGARQALAKQEADAFMWEKLMTKPLVDSGEFRRVGEIDTPWPCFVAAVREDVLQSKSEALKHVFQVINTYATSFKQRENAQQLISDRFKLEQNDVSEWLQKTEWAQNAQVSTAMLDEVMHTLGAVGAISQKVSPEQLLVRF